MDWLYQLSSSQAQLEKRLSGRSTTRSRRSDRASNTRTFADHPRGDKREVVLIAVGDRACIYDWKMGLVMPKHEVQPKTAKVAELPDTSADGFVDQDPLNAKTLFVRSFEPPHKTYRLPDYRVFRCEPGTEPYSTIEQYQYFDELDFVMLARRFERNGTLPEGMDWPHVKAPIETIPSRPTSPPAKPFTTGVSVVLAGEDEPNKAHSQRTEPERERERAHTQDNNQPEHSGSGTDPLSVRTSPSSVPSSGATTTSKAHSRLNGQDANPDNNDSNQSEAQHNGASAAGPSTLGKPSLDPSERADESTSSDTGTHLVDKPSAIALRLQDNASSATSPTATEQTVADQAEGEPQAADPGASSAPGSATSSSAPAVPQSRQDTLASTASGLADGPNPSSPLKADAISSASANDSHSALDSQTIAAPPGVASGRASSQSDHGSPSSPLLSSEHEDGLGRSSRNKRAKSSRSDSASSKRAKSASPDSMGQDNKVTMPPMPWEEADVWAKLSYEEQMEVLKLRFRLHHRLAKGSPVKQHESRRRR